MRTIQTEKIDKQKKTKKKNREQNKHYRNILRIQKTIIAPKSRPLMIGKRK